ncbi:MAG TPA: hypothetical protein PK331_09480 [Gordonia sp. (in: high G+C Gram-positive bacteria)]|uniref:hypothetical protein n=1 Tax=unclassified Gordonia (in: high G+C Gram-positive bacteria) TaxID=2657482 RepID=UPI000F9F8862|nr:MULTISPECIES: hypothetical protein [unclassified Gordonia (in: high G+C Gram-positive bacteria)]RUP38262.1 MAG: hypothetical protein EKK60_10345 [Gordonia sp. (in: high G+C Gram-positive bacteria)]HNP58314.1 hypothetical protein [Gordonia sp. (in: high G+C Gram-positive bacteria)]HRC51137.1 hypothetical protein [Gordonia sp. (in: high G+C Gram-positive bacteria)]
MRIDCDSCPGRPVACDGCMMNVLVGATNSPHAAQTQETSSISDPRAELVTAISVFRDAMLITIAEEKAAIRRITAGQDGYQQRFLSVVRAG